MEAERTEDGNRGQEGEGGGLSVPRAGVEAGVGVGGLRLHLSPSRWMLSS